MSTLISPLQSYHPPLNDLTSIHYNYESSKVKINFCDREKQLESLLTFLHISHFFPQVPSFCQYVVLVCRRILPGGLAHFNICVVQNV